MRRLFSSDPAVQTTKWFEYDDHNDTFTIHTQQDVSKLIEHNKKLYNARAGERWGDWNFVASIPNSIMFELMKSGKLDDQAYMRRFLNDPELRHFRTRPGVLDGKIGSR